MHFFDRVRLIGTREVCEILGINKSTVHRDIIARELIPCVRVSCGWVFLYEDVLTFKQKRIKQSKTDRRIRTR